MKIAMLAVTTLCLAACASLFTVSSRLPSPPDYSPSSTCKGCHVKITEQHLESHHEKSFTNPVFQEQYFQELLPQAAKDEDLIKEARTCTACHAPIAYLKNKGHVVTKEQVDPQMSGVTCDFCHTIKAYEGSTPGNGNYLSEPSDLKLGPFRRESNWHHVYSELQTKSEFCAICHNAVNHHGLEIKSTFTEWKNSRYAKEGIQCQDCHMNVYGFLTAGKPVYESGQAAFMTLGTSPERLKLYTHRFPGAHSKTQIVGAGTLRIYILTEDAPVSAGEDLTFYVLVDNEKTGHSMPSGSADLRQLWLGLEAEVAGSVIPLPALSGADEGTFDVAGRGKFDKEILGDDIPKGSRIYRAIFVDAAGKQTFSSYNAVNIVFDNRLHASEIRRETYRLKIPEDAKGELSLKARLHYLPYPSSFSNRFGLPKPEPFEVASATKSIVIK